VITQVSLGRAHDLGQSLEKTCVKRPSRICSGHLGVLPGGPAKYRAIRIHPCRSWSQVIDLLRLRFRLYRRERVVSGWASARSRSTRSRIAS
jgi:hypothetical protein